MRTRLVKNNTAHTELMSMEPRLDQLDSVRLVHDLILRELILCWLATYTILDKGISKLQIMLYDTLLEHETLH